MWSAFGAHHLCTVLLPNLTYVCWPWHHLEPAARVPSCLLQILALVLVSLLHLAYLRLCLPFRMRIELAAGGGLQWAQTCGPSLPRPVLHQLPL